MAEATLLNCCLNTVSLPDTYRDHWWSDYITADRGGRLVGMFKSCSRGIMSLHLASQPHPGHDAEIDVSRDSRLRGFLEHGCRPFMGPRGAGDP